MEISISLDPAVDNTENLEKYISECNQIRGVTFHVDIMRPSYVPRTAVTIPQYRYIMQHASHLADVHFMTDTADIDAILPEVLEHMPPRSVTFHIETIDSAAAKRYFEILRENDIYAGIAIDIDTAIESIDPELLFACDVFTVMSVKAGKSGQTFQPAALEKARTLRAKFPNTRIIMDGGINDKNIADVAAAGVSVAVIGSYLHRIASQTQRALSVAALADIARK